MDHQSARRELIGWRETQAVLFVAGLLAGLLLAALGDTTVLRVLGALFVLSSGVSLLSLMRTRKHQRQP